MSEHNPRLRPKKKSVTPARVNCIKCKHFHVTWDKQNPYGCKVFGFKGKQMPSVQVRAITGIECPSFIPNQK